MEKKKCKDCNIVMDKKSVKYYESDKNIVTYVCKNCGYETTEIEPIGV